MSRKLHLLEVSSEQLKNRHNARLVAAAVLFVSFAGFVALAPEGPKADATPEVTAAVE